MNVTVNLAIKKGPAESHKISQAEAAPWIGKYREVLVGNSADTLTIAESADGLSVELLAASNACARKFRGAAVPKRPRALTVRGLDEFGDCTLTLNRTSLGVAVVEGKCSNDEPTCSFDGHYAEALAAGGTPIQP